MGLKHSVMVGFMGRQADRFHEYQPARGFPEQLEMAARVTGGDGIEVVYPNHFAPAVSEAVKRIKECGRPVSAVNLNVKGNPRYRSGSFTSPDPGVRAFTVAEMKAAMDLSDELGAGMISCCPLIDGHNYSFQADYEKQWNWLVEGLGESVAHRSDVRISLEYKLNESRNSCLLGDVGKTLLLCERLGAAHVGVTVDVGHAFIANETPAESICLAAQMNRLFYVHFNDNTRDWDWDMLPGSVNLWDLVEMIYYLDRMKWDGWLSYDIMTRDGDPVGTMESAIEIVKMSQKLLDKIGRDSIGKFIEEGIPANVFRELLRSLL